MIRNTYIVYIDTEKSKSYLQDCLNSCAKFPNINPIPFEGMIGYDVVRLCDELGVPTIDKYRNEEDPAARREQSGAFSDQACHYLIWQKIVEDGEPGAIFEHDAIVKYDYSHMQPRDGEILWLGPRIDREDDYNPPEDCEWSFVEVERFEGTHAYAITPATAQMLIDNFRKYGFNDSLDGQLGMRNMFDLAMATVDPPPVVAVIGNGRQSSISSEGISGFWNAYHTEGFLRYVRPGCNMPIVRDLVYTNKSFNDHTADLERVLTENGKCDEAQQDVLILGGYEGLSTVWLSNKLLQHNDSYMQVVSQFRNTWEQRVGMWPRESLEPLCRYNSYFSKYYYKINIVPVEQDSHILEQAADDEEIRFDVIYVDGNHEYKDVMYDGILCWNLLNDDGILIFDDEGLETVRSAVANIIRATNATVLYDKGFIALKKVRV